MVRYIGFWSARLRLAGRTGHPVAMQPIQVSATLLRGMLPDLRLATGTMLMGRVVERHGSHGLLNLGGAILVAQLPAEVPEGARLRLAVSEVNAQAVVMRIVEPPTDAAGVHTHTAIASAQGEAASKGSGVPTGPQPQPGPPGHPPPGPPLTAPLVPVPLPGQMDTRVRVQGDESDGGPAGAGAATKAVTLQYDSPVLGRLDLRLVLGGQGLVAGVQAPPGTPVELAEAHADELRAALSRSMGVPVEVHVAVRRDRVDVRV